MFSYICKYCGKKFEGDKRNASSEYARHIRLKHSEERIAEEDKIREAIELEGIENNKEEPPKGRKEQKKEEPEGSVNVYKPNTARGIIAELISTEYLHLTPIQKAEIMDWVDDYEGLIPPTELEKLLGNFKGITSDMAKRTTDHYIMKLLKLSPKMLLSDIQRLELPISYGSQDHTGSGIGSFTPEDFSVAMEGAIERLLHKSRLLQNPDILTKPAEKILMNVADTTGIISRFMNIFFLGIEGQVRENPYIIGDASKILPKIPKLLDMGLTKEEEERERQQRKDASKPVEIYNNSAKLKDKDKPKEKNLQRVSLTELDELFNKRDEDEDAGEEDDNE